MISYISGKIIFKDEKSIVIFTNGIGYTVFTIPETILLSEVETESSLWIHLAVRENSMELFGFKTKAELDIFTLLIGVSGIGPRGALGVLSVVPPDVLKTAIGSGDTSYLTKVSGIGKKTAQKIVIELKDKIKDYDEKDYDTMRDGEDSMMALLALGYKERESREALKSLSEIKDTGEKIKQALKILGNK